MAGSSVPSWKRSAHAMEFVATSGSSASHALVDMMHFILASLETRHVTLRHVRILLLNYSKAFDSVNHHIVLRS